MKQKWTNAPTLKKLQSDLTQAMPNHNSHLQKLNAYRNILEDNLYTSSRKDKSDFRSKRFAKVVNKIVPKVEQSILAMSKVFRFESTTVNSVDKVDENEDILNYQFNTLMGKRHIVARAAKKFVEQGTVIGKVGWDIDIEQIDKTVKVPKLSRDVSEVSVFIDRIAETAPEQASAMTEAFNAGQAIPIGFANKTSKVNKVNRNRPTIEIRDSESVIIDPSCRGDITKASFVIEKVKVTMAALKSSSIKYKNLDKISISGQANVGDTFDGIESTMDAEYNIQRDINFSHSDNALKKLTMYEYWGYWDVYGTGKLVTIVASWIGNTLIRLEESPYSHGKLPFAIANYNLSSTGDVWGDSLCELIYQEQRGETNAIRAMQDITNDASVGQEFVDRTIFESPLQEDNYKAGRTVYVRKGTAPETSIFRKTTAPIPPVLFDLKGVYATDVEQTIGFIGVDGKKDAQNVTKSPTAHLTDTDVEDSVLGRFGGFFEDCARLILPMNKDYLIDNNTFTDKDNKLQNVDITKVSAEMHVSVKILSIQKRNSIANSIMELMRTNAANMTPEIAALHYVEFASMYSLDTLENAIKFEMQPKEPSPEEQELQRLQLENAQLLNEKLKAEIAMANGTAQDHMSKANERNQRMSVGGIEGEVEKDKASATLDYAQADKLGKQSALFDQEFGLVETGVKREQDKEDHEYQHAANLQREQVRTDREASQIEAKKDGTKSSTEGLVDYIGEGSVLNDSFDPSDQVFRNIADVNSTDTDRFKQPIRDAEAIQNEAKSIIRENLSFNKEDTGLDNIEN